MAPTAAVAGRGAVEVGAAVAVVVHPGEVGPERRVVLGEDGPAGALEARGQGGIAVRLRTGQRGGVERGIESGVLGQSAVAALLVGEDQLLHGDRVRGVVARQHQRAETLE